MTTAETQLRVAENNLREALDAIRAHADSLHRYLMDADAMNDGDLMHVADVIVSDAARVEQRLATARAMGERVGILRAIVAEQS